MRPVRAFAFVLAGACLGRFGRLCLPLTRLKRRGRALCALSLMMVLPLAVHAAEKCPPSPPIDNDLRLPHLAQRLAARKPVKIVAIGGMSTLGNQVDGTLGRAYPERLKDALDERIGPLDLTVVNKGVARQSAAMELARFKTDVFDQKPDLIIWETGTNDAVSGVDRDSFAAQLQSGLDQIKAHGIDVVLMNPQYSPQLFALVDFEPFIAALNRVADINDVTLFDRFGLMRHWIQEGSFHLDDLPPEQRGDMAVAIYRCVGHQLADLIVSATR